MSEAAFDALVAQAKRRAVGLVRDERITLDDGRFVLRVVEELEADGLALFVAATDVVRYLEARVGPALVRELDLIPDRYLEVC